MKSDLLNKHRKLASDLIALFRQARGLWSDYLPTPAREFIEKEMTNLGFDPFTYRLGEVEMTTLEAVIRYLQRERLITADLRLADLFFIDG